MNECYVFYAKAVAIRSFALFLIKPTWCAAVSKMMHHHCSHWRLWMNFLTGSRSYILHIYHLDFYVYEKHRAVLSSLQCSFVINVFFLKNQFWIITAIHQNSSKIMETWKWKWYALTDLDFWISWFLKFKWHGPVLLIIVWIHLGWAGRGGFLYTINMVNNFQQLNSTAWFF